MQSMVQQQKTLELPPALPNASGRHCAMCPNPIGKGRVTCSDACRQKKHRLTKKAFGSHTEMIGATLTLTPVTQPTDLNTILNLLAELKADNERLAAQLAQMQNQAVYGALSANQEQSKLAPQASAPIDGSLLEVTIATKDKSRFNVPLCNLQIGLFDLGSIKDLALLSDEVLEYGIEMKKFNGHTGQAVAILANRNGGKQPTLQALPGTLSLAGGPKEITGAAREFAPPDFDDLEL